MKVQVSLLSLSLLSALHSSAFADIKVSSSKVSVNASEGGTFTFTSFDKSKLEEAYLNVLQARYAQDRKYILDVLNTIEIEFRAFLENEINGSTGLLTLSDHSILNPTKGISAQAFLSSVRQYEQGLTSLNNRIKSLTSLPSMQDPAKKEELNGLIKFDPLVNHYEKQLHAIKEKVADLKFNIELPHGGLYVQQGMNLDGLKSKAMYSSEDIAKMRRDAARLLAVKTEDQMQLDNTYNQLILGKIRAFIQAFGISQKYRTQNNFDGLEKAKNELEESFWTRSYLRSVYGMKLGSYAVHFNKKVGNLDFFGSTRVEFINHVVRDENQLMVMQDLVFNALEAQTGSSKEVLKRETPFFSRISSFITLVSGNKQEVEANLLMLKLIAADIEEERTIGKAGGLKDMRVNYRKRFFGNKEDKEYFEKLAKLYLPSDDKAAGEEDIEADVQTVDSTTLKGVFQSAIQVLENQQDRINQGQGILETIKKLTSDNDVRKKANKRRSI